MSTSAPLWCLTTLYHWIHVQVAAALAAALAILRSVASFIGQIEFMWTPNTSRGPSTSDWLIRSCILRSSVHALQYYWRLYILGDYQDILGKLNVLIIAQLVFEIV
jgi:hypothetical protein